jgi:hypothetical protein
MSAMSSMMCRQDLVATNFWTSFPRMKTRHATGSRTLFSARARYTLRATDNTSSFIHCQQLPIATPEGHGIIAYHRWMATCHH